MVRVELRRSGGAGAGAGAGETISAAVAGRQSECRNGECEQASPWLDHGLVRCGAGRGHAVGGPFCLCRVSSVSVSPPPV